MMISSLPYVLIILDYLNIFCLTISAHALFKGTEIGHPVYALLFLDIELLLTHTSLFGICQAFLSKQLLLHAFSYDLLISEFWNLIFYIFHKEEELKKCPNIWVQLVVVSALSISWYIGSLGIIIHVVIQQGKILILVTM